MLLVSETSLLEVGEEEEVGQHQEHQKERVFDLLHAIVHHEEGANGLEEISQTGPCAESANELLWNGFDVANDRGLTDGAGALKN